MNFVRQIHTRLIEKDERIAKLESDVLEWQNKTLAAANIKPLHYTPAPIPPAVHRAPIGPTAKRNMLLEQAAEREALARPSDAEILQIANQVSKNGSK